MARRTFDVIDICEIFMHWHAGRSKNEIAGSLGLSRNTVRKYVAAAEAAGMVPGGPAVSQERWAELAREWFPELADTRLRQVTWPAIEEHRDYIVAQLAAGVTMATIHQRLRDERGLAASVASLRRYYALDDVNQAYADMRSGVNIRGVVDFIPAGQCSAGLPAARLSVCWGSVGAEELAQLLRVELGLLERREVAAAGGFGDAHDVRGALEPGPGRADDVAGEQREAGRHLDPAGVLGGGDRGVGAVHAHRRADRRGEPVDGDVGEDLVFGEAPLDVAVAVAPGAELLDDPRGEPGGGVGEPERRRSAAWCGAWRRRRPRSAPQAAPRWRARRAPRGRGRPGRR